MLPVVVDRRPVRPGTYVLLGDPKVPDPTSLPVPPPPPVGTPAYDTAGRLVLPGDRRYTSAPTPAPLDWSRSGFHVTTEADRPEREDPPFPVKYLAIGGAVLALVLLSAKR